MANESLITSNHTKWLKEHNIEAPQPLTCTYCGRPRPYLGKIIYNRYSSTISVDWLLLGSEHALPCICDEGQAEVRSKREKYISQHLARERSCRLEAAQEYMHSTSLWENIGHFKKTRFTTTSDNEAAIIAVRSFWENFEALSLLPSNSTIHNGLFISGTPGTGKTFLIAGLAQHLYERSIPVLFMTIGDLLDRIIQDMQANKNREEGSINCNTLAKTVELLAIDDVDKLKVNHWSSVQLFEILNERYNKRLPTIFTSNHSLNALGKAWLARSPKEDRDTIAAVFDRIVGMTYEVPLNGKSFRRK